MKMIPCLHMVAVTKSSKIAGTTIVKLMPLWSYMALWREQFGEGTVLNTGFDIHYLKNNHKPNPKLWYYPKIAAVEKTGMEKKNQSRVQRRGREQEGRGGQGYDGGRYYGVRCGQGKNWSNLIGNAVWRECV